MAYEIEIPTSVTVESDSKAVIELDNPTADIIDNQDRSVDIYSCTYVVVCDDIYIKNYVDQMPAWMQTYIENVTAVGLASTNTTLANLLTNFSALQDGYTATIASVTSDLSIQNATIESLVTSTNNSIAGINTTLNTKIDQTQALALISQEIATFRDFGLTEASAWWQAIINTVVTEQTAQATQLTTLNSGMNNNSASVSTLQSAVITLDSAVAKSAQYVTASVGGTTLITGFALVSSIDPAGDQISSMIFNAADFRIYTQTTIPNDTATPVFQATGSEVWFTGKVTFQGLGIDSDTTSISGGKLTTNTAWIGGAVKSSNYSWGAGTPVGFGMFSIGDPDSGQLYNIVGGKIYGASIKSATLESSTIKVRDLLVLTDSDYTTKAAFKLSPSSGTWNVSAYNSTTSANRLAVQTGSFIVFHGTTGLDGVLLKQHSNSDAYHCDIQVYLGTTLIGSGRLNPYFLTPNVQVSGTFGSLKFTWGYTDVTNSIRGISVNYGQSPSFSGNGYLNVKVRFTDYSDVQVMGYTNVFPTGGTVFNI